MFWAEEERHQGADQQDVYFEVEDLANRKKTSSLQPYGENEIAEVEENKV